MLIAAALVLIVTVDATGNAVLFLLSLHFLIVYFKNMMIKYLQDSSKVGYCLFEGFQLEAWNVVIYKFLMPNVYC